MVVIRSGSAADALSIAAVQRAGWFAAYDGIISRETIDRVTAPDQGARVRQTFRTRPWQRMIVAVAGTRDTPEPGDSGIVGYASFGPETDVLTGPWPWQRMCVAVGGRRGTPARGGSGTVGCGAYGPVSTSVSGPWPPPLT